MQFAEPKKLGYLTYGTIHISRKGNVFFHRNETTEKGIQKMSNETDTGTELIADGSTRYEWQKKLLHWHQWKLSEDIDEIEKLEKEIRNLKAQIKDMK